MGVLNDVRISIRTLTKNGAFAIAAVLTVAIGVGATTAIATIVDSILLRPLPYPDSERIVQVRRGQRVSHVFGRSARRGRI